ncbi:MAG: flagellar basal body L-ring protein FlgH [Erysipelotrichia bacterium]|nr:flagellar basal body L-ring protein FlgH [Candidatus Riflebacteria bacterium]NCB39811.1 flagellar basal body L-ring protein FlgH [Erysipelotrichia bacterium]
MHRNKLLVTIMLMVLLGTSVNAASLWLSGNDLYSSKGARDYRPGDIITIVISEESNAQSKATTNTQKETSTEIKSSPKIPYFKKIVDKFLGKNEFTNEFGGSGTTTRSGKLTGTITATVLEVMTNGNLLVEGSRSIVVNRETQIMRVRGVARPRDVDASNSINSKLLADAQIKFDGRGVVGRANRPGLMTQFIDVIF